MADDGGGEEAKVFERTRFVGARSPRKEYEMRGEKEKNGPMATSIEGIRSQCKSSLHAPVEAVAFYAPLLPRI